MQKEIDLNNSDKNESGLTGTELKNVDLTGSMNGRDVVNVGRSEEYKGVVPRLNNKNTLNHSMRKVVIVCALVVAVSLAIHYFGCPLVKQRPPESQKQQGGLPYKTLVSDAREVCSQGSGIVAIGGMVLTVVFLLFMGASKTFVDVRNSNRPTLP